MAKVLRLLLDSLSTFTNFATSVHEVGIVRDVVSVEDAAGLMSRNDHRNLLRDAVADHVPYPGSPEIIPTCLKCLIDVASGFDLCLGWHIVATDEEESGVHKYKLPDRSFRHRRISRVSRNGAALCQHCCIGLDVRSESHFDYVINSIGSQSPD